MPPYPDSRCPIGLEKLEGIDSETARRMRQLLKMRTKPPLEVPELLTYTLAAKVLRVRRSFIQNLVSKGELSAIYVKPHWPRIKHGDLNAWLAAREVRCNPVTGALERVWRDS